MRPEGAAQHRVLLVGLDDVVQLGVDAEVDAHSASSTNSRSSSTAKSRRDHPGAGRNRRPGGPDPNRSDGENTSGRGKQRRRLDDNAAQDTAHPGGRASVCKDPDMDIPRGRDRGSDTAGAEAGPVPSSPGRAARAAELAGWLGAIAEGDRDAFTEFL